MVVFEEGVCVIEKDGFVWGVFKFVVVGFGIKKFQINFVVEDEKVFFDDFQEQIVEFEDYVQFFDIVVMQKF